MDYSALQGMKLNDAVRAGLVTEEQTWDPEYNRMIGSGVYRLPDGTQVSYDNNTGGVVPTAYAVNHDAGGYYQNYDPNSQLVTGYQGGGWGPSGWQTGDRTGQWSWAPPKEQGGFGGFLNDTVFGSTPFKAATAVVGGLNLAGNYGYGPMAEGGGLTDLGSASSGSSGAAAPSLADTWGVGLEDPLVTGGGSLAPAPAAAGGAAGATAAGSGSGGGSAGAAGAGAAGAGAAGAGVLGTGLSPYQMGMLGLGAVGTIGGLANASRKPSIPGNSPTAGFAGAPLNPNNPVLDQSVAKQAQDAAYALATSRLDPQWKQAESMKDTALRNQGLVPGTEAYDSAMRDFNFAKNDAYTQAYNTAYGQGLAAQGQGFNQAATNAGLTNQSANINNAFNQGVYNANVGAQNATTSGLFGLGSTALNAYGMSQNPYGFGLTGVGSTNTPSMKNNLPSWTGGPQ